MKTGKILVQRINMEEVNLETVVTFHEMVKETLPFNIKSVVIPHTWEFKQVDDKVIYIGMDYLADVEVSTSFVKRITEDLGEEYTIVTNMCRAEVIDERS